METLSQILHALHQGHISPAEAEYKIRLMYGNPEQVEEIKVW